MALNLAATMDAIAATAKAAGVADNVYPYPAPAATPPCLVVGYPEDIDFDVTFGRGSDRATFPVFYLVGNQDELSARDRLSAVITGAQGTKDALDGTLGGVVQSARVTRCKPEVVAVAGVPYLSATFSIEVLS